MGVSLRIVTFITHLLPAYTAEDVNGVTCARSLADGTLILPMDDPDDDETGFVTVHWQGDSNRQSTVLGSQFAAIAVARYFETQAALHGKPSSIDEIRDLAQHYTVKTGETLVYHDAEDESNLAPLIGKAVKKLGEVAVVQILRKALGI